ncbi:hypothetical protein B9Z19DRAFT_967010 [Tuber borchii]|uniref:Uncharacterized protein n=1 Tax=Tuber borchii TaxID=42251 RepID=A0A2T7A4D6_TUBBO|nr:hypothetical protein B9Z19DRAFT_967010 [Tuber borchii]
MFLSNRLAWRDTTIYASADRDKVLGGLWAAEGITNENLYSMIEIFGFSTGTFTLHNNSGQLVERDGQKLQPGNYYIATNGSIPINDEFPLSCTNLIPAGTPVEPFRQAVRERDRRCVATSRPASRGHRGWWLNFKSTHVVSLDYEQHWNDSNFGRWITVPPADLSHGTINSVQNGILLTREMHVSFNNYCWSINPDDNHKIVCFTPDFDHYQIAGRHLDPEFLADPRRPPDELLRWHFRQAVLANMKGLGQPCFESESPPGSDIMGITDEVVLTV